MNLSFRSIEWDSRLIPVQMSILDISRPAEEGEGRRRKGPSRSVKDRCSRKKHDIKGDIVAGPSARADRR